MTVAVIIPWRAGCPHRERALTWVLEQYATHQPDWPVLIGHHHTGPWCKAEAIANALCHTEAELLVIADADVWCDQTAAAVDAVAAGHAWAIPHQLVHRLDETATAQLLAAGTPGPGRTQHPYAGHAGGGILAIRREVYLDCPFDPRFLGWGHEDDSLAHALRCLHGEPWRGSADLVHLWHPPQRRKTRTIGSTDSHRLLHRYRAACRNTERMRQLIAEHTATAAI